MPLQSLQGTCKNKQNKQKLFILMKLLFSSMQTQYIKIKWPFSVCEKTGCFYVGLVDPIIFFHLLDSQMTFMDFYYLL